MRFERLTGKLNPTYKNQVAERNPFPLFATRLPVAAPAAGVRGLRALTGLTFCRFEREFASAPEAAALHPEG